MIFKTTNNKTQTQHNATMKRATVFNNTLCSEKLLLFIPKSKLGKFVNPSKNFPASSSAGTSSLQDKPAIVAFTDDTHTYGLAPVSSSKRQWQQPEVKYEYYFTINEHCNRISKVYEVLPKFYNVEENKWPDRTNIYCWHCVHPFESTPVPMPVKYEKKSNTFKVRGCFCSFNCCKTYTNTHLNGAARHDVNSLITFMYRKLMNRNTHSKILKAPPVTALDIFGGPLTINEFRKSCHDQIASVTQLNFPMILINDHIEYSFTNSQRTNEQTNSTDKDLQNRMNEVAESWTKKRQKLIEDSKKTYENEYGVKVLLKKRK